MTDHKKDETWPPDLTKGQWYWLFSNKPGRYPTPFMWDGEHWHGYGWTYVSPWGMHQDGWRYLCRCVFDPVELPRPPKIEHDELGNEVMVKRPVYNPDYVRGAQDARRQLLYALTLGGWHVGVEHVQDLRLPGEEI